MLVDDRMHVAVEDRVMGLLLVEGGMVEERLVRSEGHVLMYDTLPEGPGAPPVVDVPPSQRLDSASVLLPGAAVRWL